MTSRTDRFKVGDVVVKVGMEHLDSTPVGYVATISKCDGDGLPWYEAKDNEWTDIECLDDLEWELLEIVDSPLYKALR